MDEKVIQKRHKEIEDYIVNNNLDMATKRSMDFVSDFTKEKDRKREAINIRAKYNSLRTEAREFGTTTEIDTKFTQLRNQILDFIEMIEEEFDSDDDIEAIISVRKKSLNVVDTNLLSLDKAKEEFNESKYKPQALLSDVHSLGQEDNVFVANQITKKYKNDSVKFFLEPISLSLKYGEITALVGENGNGKTTLLDIVAGELAHTDGEIIYPELVTAKKSDWYHIKTQVAYIKQELPKWKGLLKDNLHFTLAINGVKGQANIDEVDFIIYRLGLEKYIDATWNELSGGFKMRFALAEAILRKPKLLIIDEPLANLDINTQQLFLSDLRDMTNSLTDKMSVIISSQNIYEAESIADNIVFLADGKSLYNGNLKVFGENRENNSYEFSLDISEKELLIILNEIKCIEVQKNGANYLIDTDIEVTQDMLLKLFLKYNINVKYFRDISNSTRKLFGKLS